MSEDDLAGGGDLPAPSSPARWGALYQQGRQQWATDQEFSAFYRSTVRPLVAFLVNHGASVADAADIAQATMVKAYQRWDDIQHPRPWVYTVASRSLVRKISDVREDLVDEVPEPTSLLPRTDAVSEWECQQKTLHVLRGLPARQRQVLAWTFSGFTPSEIAEQLHLTPEAVRASLKKARRAAVERLYRWEEEQ
ncbi:RNA polymerase sigma factor [Streptomyces sp. CBMA152]|uniref:RNA polymerase sigma factor n=1 Tax=Streptomyces sp. CBMA152 TaxID=1896312 RepID=UPI00166158F8|nr:sigma-70 family RNA polymerase sigma factor [Streptomyces sp. CBMA152]